MGEGRGAYRILVGRPDGRRPLDRPKRRWELFKKDSAQWSLVFSSVDPHTVFATRIMCGDSRDMNYGTKI
jgi:hypothetical protein